MLNIDAHHKLPPRVARPFELLIDRAWRPAQTAGVIERRTGELALLCCRC